MDAPFASSLQTMSSLLEKNTLPAPTAPRPLASDRASHFRHHSLFIGVGSISLILLFLTSTLSLFPTFLPTLFFSLYSSSLLSEDGSLPAVAWKACEGLSERYSCARYDVPMDYSGKEEGNVSLAMIRYSADEKNKKRLGSLFLNPGGPGGSGVTFVELAGPSLSTLAGGSYDIISWDPRGVGKTEPAFRCFPNAPPLPFNISAYPDALDKFEIQMRQLVPYSKLQNMACEKITGDGIGRFLGTESVARDLERMSRAVWRKSDVEKGVNFWGFSYGTALGAYLTGIFPERIGRVIIDGVIDPQLWASASQANVLNNVFQDTDKGVEGFVEACVEVGPSRCALATDPPQSKEDLLQTLADLIDKLYLSPILVPDLPLPGVVSSPLLVSVLFLGMYTPRTWPRLATLLKDALDGNGKPILQVAQTLLPPPRDPTAAASSLFAGNGVWCNDAIRTTLKPNATDEELADSYTDDVRFRLSKVSRWFGWLGLWNTCDGFTVEEAGFGRFMGSFNQTLSNSILLVGNTADPVTSVKNAYLFSSIQPQSRVIQQDSFGHCSLASASLCTVKHIQTYLLKGDLPNENVFCKVDEVLFPEAGVSSFINDHDEEATRVLQAAREVGEALRSFHVSF
ncbi:hypothetical protein BDY24DRAFT_405259 [Mrakia frigida]|uniref:uncharacterized protein n=1 Tax=Mrakia frigida TaxID=29902 RepID=UPI003FCBFEC6